MAAHPHNLARANWSPSMMRAESPVVHIHLSNTILNLEPLSGQIIQIVSPVVDHGENIQRVVAAMTIGGVGLNAYALVH